MMAHLSPSLCLARFSHHMNIMVASLGNRGHLRDGHNPLEIFDNQSFHARFRFYFEKIRRVIL